MDRVDEIILISLRQIGCEIPSNVTSTRDFDTNMVVQACSRSLHIINSEYNFPDRLPEAKLGRFRICQNLAAAIKAEGYPNELGYHLFFYPNEKDVRDLLMFLSERLPRVDESTPMYQEMSPYESMLMQAKEHFRARSWVHPLFLRHLPTHRHLFVPSETLWQQRFARHAEQKAQSTRVRMTAFWQSENERLGGDPDNTRSNALIALHKALAAFDVTNISTTEPSPFEMPARATPEADTTFALQQQFEQEAGEPEAAAPDVAAPEESHEQRLAELQARLEEILAEQQRVRAETGDESQAARELRGQVAGVEAEIKVVEDELVVKRRIAALLPNAENAVRELQRLSIAAMDRLHKLAAEWEAHRQPLLARYRELQQQTKQNQNLSDTLRQEVQAVRDEMRQVVTQGRERQALMRQLQQEFDKLNKSVQRSSYIRTIGEIHKNIRKQRVELDKICIDTRELQKETNTAAESLGRIFGEVDELVFSTAKKEGRDAPAAKQVYKHLIAMHRNFQQLIEGVEEIGTHANRTRDLTSRIQQEEQRNSSMHLDELENDVRGVQAENATLERALKAKGRGAK